MGVRFWHLFRYPKNTVLFWILISKRIFTHSCDGWRAIPKAIYKACLSYWISVLYTLISYRSPFDFVPCSCICSVPKLWPNLALNLLLNPTIESFKFWPQICCQLWLQIYCRLGLQSNPNNRIEQIGFFKSCRMVLISSQSVIISIRFQKKHTFDYSKTFET